jgi:hypothetical protein
MIDASGETAYVHEPFNPNRSPGWFVDPLPHWFMHITEANEEPYVSSVERLVTLRYPTMAALARARSARLVALNLQQASASVRYRRGGRRLLLKDPLALFSAEWLARRFGFRVVVLIRHPASFVSSIVRLNWGFDYERNWLAQPLLMDDLLAGYEGRFSGYHGEEDLVGEGIVVWSALYDVVSRYRERHPDWTFLRYEDIARDPLAGFGSLYRELGLTWSHKVADEIGRFSSSDNPGDVTPQRKHDIKRDSRAAADTWRTRLTADQIARVRTETEPVWRRFYADEEWEEGPGAPG